MANEPLKIAVAQINCVVGDVDGNGERIRQAASQARAAGAHILVTPELSLCGYPPEDLLLRPDFYRNCDKALARLAAETDDQLAIVVGHPLLEGDHRYNAASVLRAGAIVATYRKLRLPNYEVFDEERYFDAGTSACVFEHGGVRVGLNICADVWEEGAAEASRAAGAELLLAINASPYHMDKLQIRHEVLRDRVSGTGIPVVYCNLVGGQDELVFDGASFALGRTGGLRYQAPSFEESLDVVTYADGDVTSGTLAAPREIEADVWDALVLGVRDYIGKNGFPGVLLGLSGGIDSALTLCIAVDALGADRVRAVMMPSPYTAQMSLDDSRLLVERLGVRYDELIIAPAMDTFSAILSPMFAGLKADTTEENLQARIRGMLLMALSNKTGSLVLTTGNKSEMAVGYATLYGDMAGGFAVIKDIFKTFVYRLARWRNRNGEVIPDNIITRAPSAELKPDQTDQDTLPPYEVLDAIIEAYMERDESPREIIAAGYPEHDVRRVVGMLKRNEYKRRQSPVGIRVTRRGFGKDWRYPITARYQDEY
ncbi:NAD+ synthase [Niveibacterium umoris]|uniref:Glutamine-dependent NAD(+) synthetase n=1 Tax=Niveibacterium umoris TaxID=1193620 RepID=A0A840BCL2_9RHOO|nr:NAD+ synthase [Niveibacterium umoris]MBB4010770.1 NAD+ synthase/NAD+ synthase (glutamine-hydrolyzing) [Niveibacterium umoris]